MDYSTLCYAVDEGVLTLTLNRPEKLNAWNATMLAELLDAVDRADADDDVRAIIVTGAGRAFCAGADLSGGGFNLPAAERSAPVRDGGGTFTTRLFRCLKPLIAAVNGPAVGVGATMQLAMDARIASTAAKFGFVFARRGIVPEAAASWFLPRIVGISQALCWSYSGELITPEEALAAGLVREVVEPDALMPAARAMARRFVESSAPVSIAMTRQMMWRMLGAAHPMEAHRLDNRLLAVRSASTDAREGGRSFMEKRPPRFQDRVSADMPPVFDWGSEPSWS